MKKKFTLLIAALALLTLMISPSTMKGQSDYSTDYAGNITLSTEGGSNATECSISIDGVSYNGIKAGTSSKTGAVMISVPSGTKYLHIHAAAWNNTTASLEVTPSGYSESIALTANTGISNNSPFTFNGDASTDDYYKVITFSSELTANTDLTFTAVGGKRFVIWGVTAEEGGSSTTTPTTVTINDAGLTNTDLYQGTAAGYLTATVKNNAGATISGATVTWSSNNESVATIDNGGNVTLVATGQATLTATYAGVPNQYGGSHANYQIVVTNNDPSIPGTIDNPYTVAQARAAIDASTGTQGVYATGIVSQIVTPWGQNNYQNITFNIVDNNGDEEFLQAFRCVSTEDADASTVAVGDVVLVYGNLTKYNNTIYEFAANCQLISLEHSLTPNITVTPATLSNFTYTYQEGPSASQDLTITGENLTSDVVITITTGDDYFELFDGDEYSNTLTINLAYLNEIAVRMKAGLNKGSYNGVVTFTSTGANPVEIALKGSVTAPFVPGSDIVDVLDYEATGSPTSYVDWTYTAPSGVVYAGNSHGTYQSIQLRASSANQDKSGIITTTSVGIVTKVAVTWNSNTYENRTLNVYGSNTAYSAVSDLYGDNAGELLGTIVNGTSTELNIPGSYAYIGLRSASQAMYLDEIDITWSTSGTPNPSITANNVNIEYNATSGSIAYTINNPVTGGNLTASISQDSWINSAAVNNNTVTFTCDANPNSASREATISLVYHYNTNDEVTKNVTITQAGNPNAINNISDITAAGTYTVRGTIVAKSQRGFIVGDGTGYVYYYNTNYAQDDYNIGDIVKLSGPVVVYGGVFEFNNETTITADTNSGYHSEDPTILSGADMDARVASTTPPQLSNYVQYEGTLTISGTHYNITNIDGATTAIGSISYPLDTEFASLDGKHVKVKGYYVGISSSIYYNTMIGSIEESQVIHYEYTFAVSSLTNVNTYVFAGSDEMLFEGVGSAQIYDGTAVMISVDVEEGYILESLMVDGTNHAADIEGGMYVFTMPTHDVTVTATAIEYIPPTPSDWVLTDIADITPNDIFVIVGTDPTTETSYALPNDGGTNAPIATPVTLIDGTISGEPADNLQWNLGGDATNGYTFYPNGDAENWLYCSTTQPSSSNNNIKIGTGNRKLFVLDENGYLVTNDTLVTRYLSIYFNSGVAQDWRSYINTTNGALPISFYKKSTGNSQTIELLEGWNYCSFNVDITLNDLKAALVEALPGTAIMIKGQSSNTNYDPVRNRWIGNLSWSVESMYRIKTTTSGTLTLEGEPIDPTEHTITIKPGANWIAFPLQESKTLTEAFAGFAVNGDMIKSQDGTATYARGRWQGTQLTTLEPGEGYIYKSATTGNRTFTF